MNTTSLAPVVALCLVAMPRAQGTDITFPAPERAFIQPTFIPKDHFAPNVPQPPVPLQNRESGHPHPTLAVGPANGIVQPASPEAMPIDVTQQPLGTGAFVYFQNKLVNAAGSRSPRTPEPANGVLRDTVFQTGNWHAALSPDNGETWTNISPYTFLPTADGGFCCDQQAADIASHGFLVWMLQYSQNGNGPNRLRFAVANTRDKLRSGNSSDWYYYDILPSRFGYSNSEWFDYEDIAWDGTWLYCRTNVINAGTESIIFRLGLAEMAGQVTTPIEFYRGSTIGGWSHRLAKGCVGRMAFAALSSTSQIYVWTWPSTAGASATRSTRAIASFTDATVSVPGPDGRDWAGFWNATGQIQGAYGNSTECGFSWGCAPQSGRAMPYTRVARFLLSDRSVINEHDIWNATTAYLFNDMMSNAAGDVGGVIASGSASSYVHTTNYIIDSYDPWPPATVYSQGSGSSGPNTNRFGDYFTVRRHPISTNTFVSNGSSCPDPNNGNHRYVWFGRNDYEPTWVTLTVNSTPVTGVAISQDVTDLDNRKDGATNYTRRFAPQQGYELTAPATFVSGRTTYAFERWTLNSANRALDELVLDVSTIGGVADVAEAVYKIRRTLTISSTNPSSAVAITVSPADLDGLTNGSTSFTRLYRDDQVVSLTAPATVGANPFRHWVVSSVNQPEGQRVINVTMDATRGATAVYWQHLVGSWINAGAGCVGGNGLVPSHTISQTGSQYVQGTSMVYRLTNAAANQSAVLFFGLSNTNWGSFVLPLNLNFLGITGCTMYQDVVVSQGVATSGTGSVGFGFTWPVDPAAVGSQIYTTFAFIDPTVARSLPLTYSNAVRLTLGGNH